jgi:hypothetical protein
MAEERWKGVVQASSSCGGDSFKNSSKYTSQVTVSLCFSPSNQTLLVMHGPLYLQESVHLVPFPRKSCPFCGA